MNFDTSPIERTGSIWVQLLTAILYRVNMNTMVTIEEGTVDTTSSAKPIAGLMNLAARLMYIVTETEVVSVFFPGRSSTLL